MRIEWEVSSEKRVEEKLGGGVFGFLCEYVPFFPSLVSCVGSVEAHQAGLPWSLDSKRHVPSLSRSGHLRKSEKSWQL